MQRQKAVIYARQSSGNDDQSESIDFQVEQCQELARKNHLEIVEVCCDFNTSGRLYPVGAEELAAHDLALTNWRKQRSFEKNFRTGLGRVINLLPEVNVVVVYDSTRLCRPVQHSYLQSYLDSKLVENNVELLTVKDGLSNPSKFTDSLVSTIKHQVNDNQIQITAEKSKKAMARLKDSGIIPTAPKMFGIKYLGGKNKTVEVIPECAEVIRFVFDQVIKMKPYNQIIRDMNRLFSACCSGKAYYDSSLRHIVAQPFYCGLMYDTAHNLVKAKQMEGKEIISYEIWKKANEIMARNRIMPQRRKQNPHPFTHILKCGYCGAKMIGGVDKGKEYYHCHRGSNLKRNDNCPQARLNINLVRRSDKFSGLKAAIAPFLILAMYRDLENNEVSAKQRRQLIELENVEKQLKAKNNEICEQYALGKIDFENYNILIGQVKEKRKSIGDKMMKIKSAYSPSEMAKRAKEYLEKIKTVMADGLEPHVFEQLLRSSVKEIRCFDDRVEIDTIYGMVPLKRYIDGYFRNFPRFEYQIVPLNGIKKVFDLRQAKIEVTYIYSDSDKRKVIVDFEVMKISAQE